LEIGNLDILIMLILGIDPGLATTGFGLVSPDKTAPSKLKCVAYGTIDTAPSLILPERLKKSTPI